MHTFTDDAGDTLDIDVSTPEEANDITEQTLTMTITYPDSGEFLTVVFPRGHCLKIARKLIKLYENTQP